MNEDRLPFEDFVPYAPDEPGEQVNIHHCKQGRNNDRLYIRRNEDGSIVGYCHHCGSRGYSNRAGKVGRRKRSSSVSSRSQGEFALPADFTTNTTEWHTRARAWVRRYGIKDDELADNSVGFSESCGGVVFPLFNEEGSLVCYQFRPVLREGTSSTGQGKDTNGTGAPPKYVLRRPKDGTNRGHVFSTRPSWAGRVDGAQPDVDNVVVCEDVLSAIKSSRVPGNMGVAVLGSNLKEEQAVRIAKLGENATIYFDNDNDQVINNARKAAKLLEPLMVGRVYTIWENRDPKELSTQELKQKLGVEDE